MYTYYPLEMHAKARLKIKVSTVSTVTSVIRRRAVIVNVSSSCSCLFTECVKFLCENVSLFWKITR